MPKLIENVKEKLLEQAKKQVMEAGYEALSIRKVAKACGIASGTVYNYFESKEMLVASFMAEDWIKSIQTMKDKSSKEDNPIEVIKIIYEELCKFIKIFDGLFNDPLSKTVFNDGGKTRHSILINQLSEIFAPVCKKHQINKEIQISEFILETLLTWTIQKKDFSEYIKIITLFFE